MKTAMQLMLWYLENEGLEESGAYYKAKMLLEKEKEQIIDAYDKGSDVNDDLKPLYGTTEEYYNQTYKNR
jgi:hypothetical protein